MHNDHKTIPLLLLHNEVANAIRSSGRPIFVGDAGCDYVCGACGSPLCLGMREDDLAGLALVCACGRTNLVPWPVERNVNVAAG